MAIWRLGDSFERGSGIMLVEVLTDAGDWKVCDAVPEDAESIVRDHNAALSQQPRSEGGDAAALRSALEKAGGRLGYLSTVLSHSNKPSNAKSALEWSKEALALASTQRPAEGGGRDWQTCACRSWVYDPGVHGPSPSSPSGHHPACTLAPAPQATGGEE